MYIFLGVLTALAVALAFMVQRGGGFGFPWIEFYVRGKESGFKFREIHLLRKVAVENRLKDPASLYWSERQLDRCLRGTIIRFRAKGLMKDPKSVEFLSKLFDFRKQVEFSLPKYRIGLRSSRNILTGQRIKIPFPGMGLYESQVVENMRKYLAIAYPQGKALPPGFSWQGQKINVHFWRAEDAGYYFESKVLGDYLDRKFPILHIGHSDNLVRNQKRGSIRIALSCGAGLYPLKTIDQANEVVESMPGYRGKMLDLSEDGFAVVVGGKAKAGLPVKLQFHLNDSPIVMCGIVKGVTFNQKNNQSILHGQAVKPSDVMKIDILTYVYGIFREPDGKKPAKAAPAPAAPPDQARPESAGGAETAPSPANSEKT
jgi:c-di-GMP-binding flagellar brake protein YcgR